MLVVSGSARVRLPGRGRRARRIFMEAGAEWRAAGCSMCLGMNPDTIAGRTRRLNMEPELRRQAGEGLPNPPRLTAGRCSDRRRRSSGLAGRHRLTRASATCGGRTMDALVTHTGTGLPLRRGDLDTDQIIPAVYLKRITRTGFEDGLSRRGRTTRIRGRTTRLMPVPRCWSPARTSEPGRHASTPSGPCRTVDLAVVLSPVGTIFKVNSGKSGLLAAQVDQSVVDVSRKPKPTRRCPSRSTSRAARCAPGPARTGSTPRHQQLHPLPG